jgi:hypothetical protein
MYVSHLYTVIASTSLSIELASLNKLTANPIPVDNFLVMLQQVMIQSPPEA